MRNSIQAFSVIALILLTSCQSRQPKKYILGRAVQPGQTKTALQQNTVLKTQPIEKEITEAIIKVDEEAVKSAEDKVAEQALSGEITEVKDVDTEKEEKTVSKEEATSKEEAVTKPFNAPEVKNLSYTVKEGDHFYSIASMHGVAVEDLARLNSATPAEKLSVGQKVTLPLSARLIPENKRKKKFKKSAKFYDPSKGEKYRVKSGDYLYKIAKQNNTTVKAVMKANNLSSDRLEVGQLLIIPGGSSYTPQVKDEGKTLFVSPEKDPIEVKNTKDQGKDKISDSPVDKPADPVDLAKMQDVLIVEDDTLESLSKDFDTTPAEIKASNPNIKSDKDLEPGLIIKIPKKD